MVDFAFLIIILLYSYNYIIYYKGFWYIRINVCVSINNKQRVLTFDQQVIIQILITHVNIINIIYSNKVSHIGNFTIYKLPIL